MRKQRLGGHHHARSLVCLCSARTLPRKQRLIERRGVLPLLSSSGLVPFSGLQVFTRFEMHTRPCD